MGSEVINPIKTRFDLSMSRRTRKPWSSLINEHQELSTQSSEPEKEHEQNEDRETDRKSLNNLMRSEQETKEEAIVNNKSSLGQDFGGEDEGIKQAMQLVVKKEKQGGENGVKFKGMMGRYVKVLSGLMKAKRDRKTSVLRFKT